MKFKVLNWNIAGAKFLEKKKDEREKYRTELNESLKDLIKAHKPDVLTLQEIVRYKEPGSDIRDLIDPIDGYNYYSFPLIDTENLSIRAKWNKLVKYGEWNKETFFAQGNSILFKKELPHFPVWSLPKSKNQKLERDGHFIEQVSLQSGLYFGDRDTEPRAALVAHFVYDVVSKDGNIKPLDIFVVSIHLTTLTMEREGIPSVDAEASSIRLYQLNTIFNGIVSRYNSWRQQGYLERGKPRKPEEWETHDRYPPIWIVAGDFNFTPESVEYKTIQMMNFIDCVPIKGNGTKAKGTGLPATIVLDYIFAGPKFISLDPLITENAIRDNQVSHNISVSDHYPMCATIPIEVKALEE